MIAKLRSGQCAPEGFDLHIYPVGGVMRDGSCEFWFPVACMTPRSRGSVRLRSADGAVGPLLDHAYLSDPDGHDHAVLRDGVEISRELARSGPFGDLLGDELAPTAGLDARAAVDATVAHYYHPAGTCAMGSVVDERLQRVRRRGALRRRLLGLPGRPAREHVHPGGARGPPAGGSIVVPPAGIEPAPLGL